MSRACGRRRTGCARRHSTGCCTCGPISTALQGLDLFAGTGALGFELASRGARRVTLVEAHARALEGLRATRTRLGAEQVEIVAGDALTVATGLPAGSFDVVFLDPPFDAPPAGAGARRGASPAGKRRPDLPRGAGTVAAGAGAAGRTRDRSAGKRRPGGVPFAAGADCMNNPSRPTAPRDAEEALPWSSPSTPVRSIR